MMHKFLLKKNSWQVPSQSKLETRPPLNFKERKMQNATRQNVYKKY